jgi:kynurenine formamidase
MTDRYTIKPPGSNWGEFGPDDQIGRLNYITSAKVLQGVAEVKIGKTFCLSLPLNLPGNSDLAPARRPPKIRTYPVGRRQVPFFNFRMSRVTPGVHDITSDDMAIIYLQHSTQWDGLAHYGRTFDATGNGEEDIRYYNGYKGGEDVITIMEDTEDGGPYYGGALKLGIEKFAETCVQGRGVMIDLEKHFGRERRAVGYAELRKVMEMDNVIVEKGDMVCFRTGLAQLVLEQGTKTNAAILNTSCSGLNGGDPELLNWITDTGLAAIATDNVAVELWANDQEFSVYDGSGSPLHRHCLFNLGIPLGELWYLTELADWLTQHKRNRFLLTAPPLRLPGAVGSPLTPVATV